TGPLLAWLRSERPQFLDRLAGLVRRDQVEIVGGGWYEPVLAALPERDRVGQLTRMADELEELFGARPRGAWLAERVWGPYTTDDQGKVLTVFGTEQGLRYRIPFSSVDDVIGYLRDHATERGERVG